MAAADKGANVEVRVSLRGLPRTLVEKRSVFVIVRDRPASGYDVAPRRCGRLELAPNRVLTPPLR